MNAEHPRHRPELAPDASMGEVRAEIDSARHDVADTVTALVDRLASAPPLRRLEQARAMPAEVARVTAQVPVWLKVGVPAIFVLWLFVLRRRHD